MDYKEISQLIGSKITCMKRIEECHIRGWHLAFENENGDKRSIFFSDKHCCLHIDNKCLAGLQNKSE